MPFISGLLGEKHDDDAQLCLRHPIRHGMCVRMCTNTVGASTPQLQVPSMPLQASEGVEDDRGKALARQVSAIWPHSRGE